MITNAQLTHTPGPSTCRFPHIGVPSLFVLLYTLPEEWISSQICTFSSFCCRRPVIFVLLLTLVIGSTDRKIPSTIFQLWSGSHIHYYYIRKFLCIKYYYLLSKRFLNLEDLKTNALPSPSRDCFGVTTAGSKDSLKIVS